MHLKIYSSQDVPGGPVVESPLASAGDMSLILIQEDPTCWGAAKLKHHNNEPSTCSDWTHVPRAGAAQEKPSPREAHVPQLESSLCLLQLDKAHAQQWRPAQQKIN